jgi:DNA-binding Xre family transcriptional regulator
MIMMDYQNNTWTAPNGESPAIAYLSRVGELDRQIRLKKSKLEILRDALSLRSPVMTDMPKAPSPSLQSMEDRLCNILKCDVSDIITHIPDNNNRFGL